MTFTWTGHRFAGGALALDVANSVVLRHHPDRRIDRYAEPAALHAFSSAANDFSAEAALLAPVDPLPAGNRDDFIALREAIDRHFRAVIEGLASSLTLADLLDAISATLRRYPTPGKRMPLDLATAHSALQLLSQPQPDRLKICPNCGWLFLDRSRNRSRAWCDMAVCGNRMKASRHYRRRQAEASK